MLELVRQYAAPPQPVQAQAARQPLTEDQIAQAWDSVDMRFSCGYAHAQRFCPRHRSHARHRASARKGCTMTETTQPADAGRLE